MHLDARVHGPAHDPAPVAKRAYPARHGQRRALAADRGQVGPAAEGEAELGADAGGGHRLDRGRVPHGGHRDVLEARVQHGADRGHLVLGAARAAIVRVVQEDHRAVQEALGLGHRFAERPAPVDEILAQRPGVVEQARERRLGPRALAVRDHDRAQAGLGNVGQREAAKDGGGQRSRAFLGARHGDEPLHRLVVVAHA